jgi:DNA polymerase III subunit gamma/tau
MLISLDNRQTMNSRDTQLSSLNNRWRPTEFADVVGQDRILRILDAYIQAGLRTPIIFDGQYGAGKTTLTKILAAQYHTPPESVLSGTHPDVLQINAANKTGVKEIEILLDSVHYNPQSGTNKTYIIDEFHALSHAAYNAFLQTLENCPPNVRFFFATTEKHKIPDAVLSRCFSLTLNPIKPTEIYARLKHIATQENINIENSLLKLISENSNGSLRDAIKYLEQINLLGANPNPTDVYSFLEIPAPGTIESIVDAIQSGNYELPIDSGTTHPYALLRALLTHLSHLNTPRWVPVTQSLLEVLEAVKYGLHSEVILRIALYKAIYVYHLDTDNPRDGDHSAQTLMKVFPEAVEEE